MFKKVSGNWTRYRDFPNVKIVDFHLDPKEESIPYLNMNDVYKLIVKVIHDAQQDNLEFVLFTHGWSTSRRGKTTCRSQVRSFMRSKEATPYIIRSKCIQHHSVFVAAIRKFKASSESLELD